MDSIPCGGEQVNRSRRISSKIHRIFAGGADSDVSRETVFAKRGCRMVSRETLQSTTSCMRQFHKAQYIATCKAKGAARARERRWRGAGKAFTTERRARRAAKFDNRKREVPEFAVQGNCFQTHRQKQNPTSSEKEQKRAAFLRVFAEGAIFNQNLGGISRKTAPILKFFFDKKQRKTECHIYKRIETEKTVLKPRKSNGGHAQKIQKKVDKSKKLC